MGERALEEPIMQAGGSRRKRLTRKRQHEVAVAVPLRTRGGAVHEGFVVWYP